MTLGIRVPDQPTLLCLSIWLLHSKKTGVSRECTSELMTRLSKLDDEIEIVVYGMQGWKEHENIDVTYKEKYGLRIPACEFIDLEDKGTYSFMQGFRAQFGIDPGKYAISWFIAIWFHFICQK